MVPSKRPGETTHPKVSKLRRLGRFDPEQVESTETKEAETTKPEGITKDSKDGLLDTPSFVSQVCANVAVEEPPVYNTQGEDIGRKRGRKPTAKNGEKGGVVGKKTGKGKGKKNGKGGKKGKRVAKGKKVKNGAKKGQRIGAFKKLAMTSPPRKTGEYAVKPPSKRSLKPAKPTPPAEPAPPTIPKDDDPTQKDGEQQGPVHHGNWRVPPSHVKYNGIYSSAYRKNLVYGADFARAAGQLAGHTWRESGYVDDLCWTFREAPRAKKNHTHDDTTE